MSAAKQALLDAIQKAGGLTSAKLGSTLYVFSGSQKEEQLNKLRRTAQRTGEALEVDGAREWYEWCEIFDADRAGTDCYQWHADGNRVLHELVKTVIRGAEVTKTVLRKAYRKMEEI